MHLGLHFGQHFGLNTSGCCKLMQLWRFSMSSDRKTMPLWRFNKVYDRAGTEVSISALTIKYTSLESEEGFRV